MGRTVNVAARVQDLTRRLGAHLIITEALRQDPDPNFQLRPLPDTTAKGLAEPLQLHAVLGHGASAR